MALVVDTFVVNIVVAAAALAVVDIPSAAIDVVAAAVDKRFLPIAVASFAAAAASSVVAVAAVVIGIVADFVVVVERKPFAVVAVAVGCRAWLGHSLKNKRQYKLIFHVKSC